MISATRKKINKYLQKYGISETFEIETEAEEMILMALRNPTLSRVEIDHEGYLYMEFTEENEQRTI